MNRRELLASLGTATTASVAFAGCLGQETVQCDPRDGDAQLGDIPVGSDGTVSFRGAVVGLPENGRVLVNDTTGNAALAAGEGVEAIDTGEIDVGDCLRGEGQVVPDSSWSNQMSLIAVTALESVGPAERDVSAVGARPETSFEVDYETRPDDCETVVTLQHAGGDAVPANELLVVHRASDANSTANDARHWWHDLDEAAGPDAPVEEGDSVSFTVEGSRNGSLVWVGEWSDRFEAWDVSPC